MNINLINMPITIYGIDDEWKEAVYVGGDQFMVQNKLCPSVFMHSPEGYAACYHYAIVFKTIDGKLYHGKAFIKSGERIDSSQYIHSPFTPKSFIVNVIEKEPKDDDTNLYITKEEELTDVFKYYDKRPEKHTNNWSTSLLDSKQINELFGTL